MSETVRQVLTRAARKVGASSEGQIAPNAYDIGVLKDVLFDWYRTAIDAGTFGELKNVAVQAAYTAGENQRISDVSGASVVITLPATITDVDPETGMTRPRAPRDASVVQIAGGNSFLYDLAQGAWVNLDTLTLDSPAPLSAKGADGLAAVVAVLVMEERGLEPGALTVSRAARFRLALASRHSQPRQAVAHTFY